MEHLNEIILIILLIIFFYIDLTNMRASSACDLYLLKFMKTVMNDKCVCISIRTLGEDSCGNILFIRNHEADRPLYMHLNTLCQI